MASIHRERRNGKNYYRLQFYNKDNERKSIRLGTIAKKDADVIRVKVERLVSASIAGAGLDNETSRWLADIGDDLAGKLTNAGFGSFIPKRESATLAAFIDGYIHSRTDAADNTVRNWKNSRDKLVDYFGADRNLRDIKPGDADEWRQSLVKVELAGPTISKAVKHAKQFFRLAARKGLIEASPFADVKAGGERNDERLEFVERDTVQKIVDATGDVEWKLIVALARYGGLRTPSEMRLLKWTDINWADDRMTVTSPKTKRHGKASRVVPLFPELRPILTAAFEQAEPGAVYVVPRCRDKNVNLRTHLERLIRRAGVKQWERLFQNLRSSRQTELENEFPSHVVCAWMGNTESVARKHYLQVTADHFSKAVSGGATGGAVVVQKPVLQASADGRTDSQKSKKPSGISAQIAVFPEGHESVIVPPRGLEPLLPD